MPTQFLYVIMIVAIFFSFMLSKKRLKEMRFRADKFAMAYLKLSNYISPEPPRKQLSVERFGESGVRPMPLEQQPEELRFILRRGNTEQAEELYREMDEAAADIERHCLRSRGLQVQFAQPIGELCVITRTFLDACIDLNSIDDRRKENIFYNFLNDQLKHRLVLLRRVSKESSEEFFALNKNYDLIEAEKERRAQLLIQKKPEKK